ncbi:UDP-N-acetylenolpyruvoylglucosamine reductase [Candidatus Kaiserbacteria bacterium RIFCSPHIGHO2_01_FULL_51_33]|uniref:UDP-N-acetylenolpyruvoylglucosamine reductase n=1 Tax=Candidatus Kaiserbacteria bacterium RIFCSPLOWO2_01_FULL_51_21 TaxID=1798508 RepID=A0A1F6EEB5_9BACT|nr:MAG: UDP-N-acetylenolpyruvoylglucosamine reductase [Candidatus Kaiserbacteria bacterium RIFCSPHIGHO2_01_FULL_51_33]OGG71970.1 MAG: UDP-N-acetylenolpyruvoylglucosamine reductase [Candidatus Kaiserbacteria bacterium RIFCSPLOWO2_01_FULL_51_21]
MEIEREVLLASFTTFQIGGRARFFARVRTPQDLKEALEWGEKEKVPFFVLGGGSNLLISDDGFPGLVIKIEIGGVSLKEEGEVFQVVAGAGEPWDPFVVRTIESGLSGLENLSGIPGTVGGTPVQNVGAYGVEVGTAIAWVEAYSMKTYKKRLFQNTDCQFGYRTSFFKTEEGRQWIITRVAFHLSKNGAPNLSYREVRDYFTNRETPPTPLEVREAVLLIRSRKFPDIKVIGTAGSFFKNPAVDSTTLAKLLKEFPDLPHFPLRGGGSKIALGALLERLQWKGVRRGRVGVFEKQSLVLVNYGGSTAQEMREFAENIIRDVREKTGIEIVPEIVFIGDRLQIPGDLPRG